MVSEGITGVNGKTLAEREIYAKTSPNPRHMGIDPLTKEECVREGIPISVTKEQYSLLEEALKLANKMTSELNIRTTFFVTASLCEEIGDSLKMLSKEGHQIGCYGLTHGDDDNYAKL
ncbi:hypothetical protein CW713_00175 [Methanophagales archaeon]|nr:MAG: hypothetical protein CW713_00175 [Methanophagales archaeon]